MIGRSPLVCEFFVEGLPQPQGSKNAWVNPATNRAVVYDDNAKVLKPWRKAVTEAALAAKWRDPVEGALVLVLDFTFVRPKSVRREFPSVRPDLSKLTRAVEDSITDAAVWKDDAQIVDGYQSKRYAEREGVLVKIYALEETGR